MDVNLKEALENKGLTEPELSRILEKFKVAYFDKGQSLVRPSEETVPAAFVEYGTFVESVTNSGGREFIHSFYGPGEFMSCMFRWGRKAHSSIVCLTKACVLLYAGRPEDFSAVLSANADPAVSSGIDSSVDACLRDVNARLEEFATLDAAERYRIFLDKYAGLENDIPLHMAASYIGVTPTQLSRIRKK